MNITICTVFVISLTSVAETTRAFTIRCGVSSSWDVVRQKKSQTHYRKLRSRQVDLLSVSFPESVKTVADFTGIELVRHPTLGEGVPSIEKENESRPVVNTSKMEIDKLSVLQPPLINN